MLTRTLLPAKALGLTAAAHAALLLVLSKLERGELVHVHLKTLWGTIDTPNAFNMYAWDCGTAHCILGWAAVFEPKIRWATLVARNGALGHLCYGSVNNNAITTDQAAAALRNYLATGEPRWAEVLA